MALEDKGVEGLNSSCVDRKKKVQQTKSRVAAVLCTRTCSLLSLFYFFIVWSECVKLIHSAMLRRISPARLLRTFGFGSKKNWGRLLPASARLQMCLICFCFVVFFNMLQLYLQTLNSCSRFNSRKTSGSLNAWESHASWISRRWWTSSFLIPFWDPRVLCL